VNDLSAIRPQKYSKKEREFLNEVLEHLLSIYGHPFSVAAHHAGVESDPVEMLQNAPGIVSLFEAAAHYKKGTLSRNSALWLVTLLDHLVSTLVKSDAGDELAKKQMEAVAKLLEPKRYELPETAIDDLLEKHHTKPALARAWRIRWLMGKLSWGVMASKEGQNVLEGKIKLTTSRHMQRETTYWPEFEAWRSAYDVAREHWPKRGAPSLKSLAVKVYAGILEREGFTTINEASLENDLQLLAEWDKTHIEENERSMQVVIFNLGGPNIWLPTQPFSEGWKRSGHYEQNKERLDRKRKRQGKSRQIKKGDKNTKLLPP